MNRLQIFERNWRLRKHYHSDKQPKIKATQYDFIGWRYAVFIFNTDVDTLREIEGVRETDNFFVGFYGRNKGVSVHILEKFGIASLHPFQYNLPKFQDRLFVHSLDLVEMINLMALNLLSSCIPNMTLWIKFRYGCF